MHLFLLFLQYASALPLSLKLVARKSGTCWGGRGPRRTRISCPARIDAYGVFLADSLGTVGMYRTRYRSLPPPAALRRCSCRAVLVRNFCSVLNESFELAYEGSLTYDQRRLRWGTFPGRRDTLLDWHSPKLHHCRDERLLLPTTHPKFGLTLDYSFATERAGACCER